MRWLILSLALLSPTPQQHQHDHSAEVEEGASAEAVYVCPMHPEVTSDKPGTCPKCKMKLVEKK